MTDAKPFPKSSWSRKQGARSGHTLTCKTCGASFYVEPYRLRSTIKPGYCSLKCWGKKRTSWRGVTRETRELFNLTRKGERVCRLCGDSGLVHAHHAVPVSIGTAESRLDLRNLLPLCVSCHQRWHTGTPITRAVFTAEEWAYISGLTLTGRETAAWLDKHYPATWNDKLGWTDKDKAEAALERIVAEVAESESR